MYDDRVCFDVRGRAPFLPRRAEKYEGLCAGFDIHGDDTATG